MGWQCCAKTQLLTKITRDTVGPFIRKPPESSRQTRELPCQAEVVQRLSKHSPFPSELFVVLFSETHQRGGKDAGSSEAPQGLCSESHGSSVSVQSQAQGIRACVQVLLIT